MELLSLDRPKAFNSIAIADAPLWPVNAYTDADELNALVNEALSNEIISGAGLGARLAIHPMSLSDPEPVVAFTPGHGPALLGQPLGLHERDGEDPVQFTLRLLEEVTTAANALLTSRAAATDRLDRLAAYLSQPGPWYPTRVCAMLAEELRQSGRHVSEHPIAS